MAEKYPRTLIVLKPGTRKGEPYPTLHKVPVHSATDEVNVLTGGSGKGRQAIAYDVSELFVKKAAFGRSAEVPVELATKEGHDAALDHLRSLGDALPADIAKAL